MAAPPPLLRPGPTPRVGVLATTPCSVPCCDEPGAHQHQRRLFHVLLHELRLSPDAWADAHHTPLDAVGVPVPSHMLRLVTADRRASLVLTAVAVRAARPRSRNSNGSGGGGGGGGEGGGRRSRRHSPLPAVAAADAAERGGSPCTLLLSKTAMRAVPLVFDGDGGMALKVQMLGGTGDFVRLQADVHAHAAGVDGPAGALLASAAVCFSLARKVSDPVNAATQKRERRVNGQFVTPTRIYRRRSPHSANPPPLDMGVEGALLPHLQLPPLAISSGAAAPAAAAAESGRRDARSPSLSQSPASSFLSAPSPDRASRGSMSPSPSPSYASARSSTSSSSSGSSSRSSSTGRAQAVARPTAVSAVSLPFAAPAQPMPPLSPVNHAVALSFPEARDDLYFGVAGLFADGDPGSGAAPSEGSAWDHMNLSDL